MSKQSVNINVGGARTDGVATENISNVAGSEVIGASASKNEIGYNDTNIADMMSTQAPDVEAFVVV